MPNGLIYRSTSKFSYPTYSMPMLPDAISESEPFLDFDSFVVRDLKGSSFLDTSLEFGSYLVRDAKGFSVLFKQKGTG